MEIPQESGLGDEGTQLRLHGEGLETVEELGAQRREATSKIIPSDLGC